MTDTLNTAGGGAASPHPAATSRAAEPTTAEPTTDPHGVAHPEAAANQPPPGNTHPLRVVHTRHWWRWGFSAVAIFLAAQFAWSVATTDRYQWDVFAEYFFSPAVLKGLQLTLWLTVISGAIGFLLGGLLAVARLSASALLNSLSWGFIWFFRSVPLVVQLVVWYNLGYLYPKLGLGWPFSTDFWIAEFDTVQLISSFAAAVLGLSLHQAAYSAEIIRAGIVSVDQGQLEAAAALGLPKRVRFFRIILPQAARAIVPNAFNEVIGLVKGTSVVFVVALPELFYTVQVVYNRNQLVIPLLLVAVVWYAIITTVLSIAQFYIERYYARGSVRVLPPTPRQRFTRWVTTQWARLDDPEPDAGAGATTASTTHTAGGTR
ncbi:amino acid ABC transporter permease [Klugiella xanthotipulae]|uniref:Amino acid ABC transporter membrane protein (PAAT family) n=1 Tax=Klugiella xanthotipulae TaxID=244735 RepID=A0A543HZ20_9MICO|nr:amino acid ABC transporter permease [Klugiella xanthotipulae]TQM63596.1 amino acid ABC transporter membrane protein (PAAT family) [Klugiella xanthotipulae]